MGIASVSLFAFVCSSVLGWKRAGASAATSQDDETGRGTDFWTCDRECRWKYGFYDRRIRGRTVWRPWWNSLRCKCYRVNGQGKSRKLGSAPYRYTDTPFEGPPPENVTFDNARPFDPDFWADTYLTPYLCAVNLSEPGGKPFDVHADCTPEDCEAGREALELLGLSVLHGGRCGACSSPADIKVLYDTRSTITEDMSNCARNFKMNNTIPFGPAQTLGELKQCLWDAGIAFSDDGGAWEDPDGKPTCFDCWTDNIMNDGQLCFDHCLSKFFSPENAGDFANDPCLQCDEYTSGPAFIACAGANRRSAGIASDIDRDDLEGTDWQQRICTVGFCSAEANATSPCASPLPWAPRGTGVV